MATESYARPPRIARRRTSRTCLPPSGPAAVALHRDRKFWGQLAEFVQRSKKSSETNRWNKIGGGELLGRRVVARGAERAVRRRRAEVRARRQTFLASSSQVTSALPAPGYAQQLARRFAPGVSAGHAGQLCSRGGSTPEPHLRMMEWRVTNRSAPLRAVGRPILLVLIHSIYKRNLKELKVVSFTRLIPWQRENFTIINFGPALL
jgi:hypothetical protein